jgi:hypothetical protein
MIREGLPPNPNGRGSGIIDWCRGEKTCLDKCCDGASRRAGCWVPPASRQSLEAPKRELRGSSREDSRSSARWSFSIDFDNQLVNADVPVNWTWITPREVLFAHAAFAGGRQYITQLYTLDRRTGAFEMCDYGGDSEARDPCTRQYVCRATLLAFSNAF